MRKRYQKGSLSKVNGRWIAQWWEHGHRRKQTLGLVSTMTKSQARLELGAILEPINQQVNLPSFGCTFGEFVSDVFLPFYRRKWKDSTASTTERRIQGHLLKEFSERTLDSFRRDGLQDWLERKAVSGLSFSSLDHLRWDLNQIFRMATVEGFLRLSPTALLFTPRKAKRAPKRRMSWKEVSLCLSVLDPRERLIGMLALLAGMRVGEILGLMWDQVSPGSIEVTQRVYQGKIDTPKTFQSRRTVVVSDDLAGELERWRSIARDTGPKAWVFPSENGRTPLSPENLWRRNFLPRLGPVGLKWVNFQVMRRTHASLMHELGVDPKVVADQLGHSLDVNLNVYTDSGLEVRRQAANQFASALQQKGPKPSTIM